MTRRVLAVLLPFAALLASAGVSHATVTQTTISEPANGTIHYADRDANTGTVHIAGTAVGASDGDKVDIACYNGAPGGTPLVFKQIVPTAFTVTSGQFAGDLDFYDWLAGQSCRLAAVPAFSELDDIPDNPVNFAGPVVQFNEKATNIDNVKPTGFGVYAGQFPGSFYWDTAGACGLADSKLIDVTNAMRLANVFDCAARFHGTSDDYTTSPIRIGGKNGVLPGFLRGNAMEDDPEFPALSYSTSFDASGNLTLTESEEIATCSTNAFPAYADDCEGLEDSVVSLNRTVKQGQNGKQAIVTDSFVSTDGNSHPIDVIYTNGMAFAYYGGSGHIRYLFPGGAEINDPAHGTVVGGPIAAGSTIRAFDPNYPDGSQEAGRAAITLGSEADFADFSYPSGFEKRVRLHYVNRTVPASGAFTITTTYTQALTDGELTSLIDSRNCTLDPVTCGDPGGGPATPAKPTLTGASTAKAKRGTGSKPKVTITLGRSLNCPATSGHCSAKVKLVGTVKAGTKRRPRTKKLALGTYTVTVPAGGAKRLSFVLAKSLTKYFKSFSSMSLAAGLTVSDANGVALIANEKFKLKSPRFR